MIALAAVMMAVLSAGLAVSDGSDASIKFGELRGEGFTNSGEGTLFVPLESSEPYPVVMTVVVTDVTAGESKEVARAVVTVPAESPDYVAELRFRLDGLGDRTLKVTCTPDYYFAPGPPGIETNTTEITVNVSESLWSKPTTYGAIAVIAILIAIAAFMRMRNAPATKPETTFTDLERQKKGSEPGAEDARKASATERRRYGDAPKASDKPQAPPPEKKAATFTELDKQKKAEKAATEEPKKADPAPKKTEPAPKKSAPKEEPKKLKYVSSRRK